LNKHCYAFFFVLIFTLASFACLAKTFVIGGAQVPSDSPILKSTVSLLMNYKGKLQSFCTGTVLNSFTVLTAAHCLAELSDTDLYVSYGASALSGPRFKIKYFKYFSKDYYSNQFVLEHQDIALLVTEEELPLIPLEIALPNKLLNNSGLIQAGYGHTTESCDDGPCYIEDTGDLMMKLDGIFSSINERVVSVDETKVSRIARGDSGGPLLILENEKLQLHGVLSQSTASSDIDGTRYNFQALYTHPYYFINWINCSLPSELQIASPIISSEQVPCDNLPLLSSIQLVSFNKERCEESRKEFSLVDNSCWPITQTSCMDYATEIGENLTWNIVTGKCDFDE
jgi:secreted trypsin-like serine protease